MRNRSGRHRLSSSWVPWLIGAVALLVWTPVAGWGPAVSTYLGDGPPAWRRACARWIAMGPLGGWSALFEGGEAGARGPKVLRVAESDLPMTLNPLAIQTMVERRSLELLHDGLYAPGDTGQAVASLIARTPDGATRFVALEDGLVGEGWLKDTTFHNGEPVTVTDLRKTLQALSADRVTDRSGAFFRGLVNKVEPMEPDPAHHFRIVFQRRVPNLRSALTFKLLPAKAFKSPDPRDFATDKAYRRKPIGAGPFVLVSDNLNQTGKAQLTFRAHERYHMGRPKLDQIILLAIPLAADKLFQFRAGQIDVIVSLSKRDQSKAYTYGAAVVPYPVKNWWYLGFNCAQPLLKDAHIRRALAKIVNRHAMARKIGKVYEAGRIPEQERLRLENALPGSLADAGELEGASAILTSGPFVPSSAFYNRAVPQPVTDPAAGRQELLADPRITQRGDRLFYRGAPLTLELRVDQSLTNATDVVNQLVQDFADVGIGVDARMLSTSEWEADISPVSGGAAEGIDLFLGRWNFNYSEDISAIFRSNGSLNYYRYKNAEVDRLFDAAYYEPDFTRRANMMKQVHALLAADMPCLFLWQANEVAAFSTRVSGYAVHSFSFYVNLYKWDIKEEDDR